MYISLNAIFPKIIKSIFNFNFIITLLNTQYEKFCPCFKNYLPFALLHSSECFSIFPLVQKRGSTIFLRVLQSITVWVNFNNRPLFSLSSNNENIKIWMATHSSEGLFFDLYVTTFSPYAFSP